jgi:DeoR family glycerol-3-phosphate regulon repressor
MAEEKSAIAKRAAELLPNNVSMFINIGTTTEKVAEFLASHRGLLVITNNINVASLLWPNRGMEVIVANGTIRHEDGGIVGSSTEEFIRKFKVDYAIIGCSSIEDGEIFDFDLREVRVAQAIIRRARSIILVTDSIKFTRRAPICLGMLSQIDYLVTDDGIPEHAIQACMDNEVHLEIVNIPGNEKMESNTTETVNYGN